MQQPHVLIILCIHVQKLGHEDLWFHLRMIRPVVGGSGAACLKQILFHSRMIRPGRRAPDLFETNAAEPQRPKEKSTKTHEERRRATKALEKA